MTDAPATTRTPRFHALEGLRGILALAVLIGHYTEHNGVEWVQGHIIAVDMFFVLSGFVVMHGYGKKILGDLSFGQFVYRRLIRLGPLYLIGLALGIAAATPFLFSNAPRGAGAIGASDIATAVGFNLLFLPYLNDLQWPFGADSIPGTLFPLNDPMWSLFFEICINMLLFAYLAGFKAAGIQYRALAGFVAFTTLFYAFLVAYFHLYNPGWGKPTFIFGLPRLIPQFFLGVLIYRLHDKFNPPPSRTFTVLLIVLLTACFFTPLEKISLVTAFILSPLLILSLSRVALPRVWQKLCTSLGSISYPLYATHFPIYRLMQEFTGITALAPAVQSLLTAVIAIATAFLMVRIDQNIRDRLPKNPSFLPRQPIAAGSAE